MIVINKNQTNNVVVTLTESPNYNNTNYVLFVFENKQTGVVKYFQSEDTSPYKVRYNRFNVIEDETEDLLQSTIHLTGNTQELNYKVYSLNSQIQNLTDLDNAYTSYTTNGNPCEEGLVRVVGLEQDITINNIYL